jgi:hypothetical protein
VGAAEEGVVEDKVYFLDQEYSGHYDDKVWKCIECYLNLPETLHLDQNPLNCTHICELQQQDKQLLALQVNNSVNKVNLQLVMTLMTSSVIRMILFNSIGNIALPKSMVVHTIKWFHQVMRHPGEKKIT